MPCAYFVGITVVCNVCQEIKVCSKIHDIQIVCIFNSLLFWGELVLPSFCYIVLFCRSCAVG